MWRAAAVMLALTPCPALSQTEVDLELVLLADSSGSITEEEIRFQRQSYATALTDRAVVDAITGTLTGSVAITYVEWGQFDNIFVIAPWTVIAGPEDARRFADVLLDTPRKARGRNAIGQALIVGRDLIEGNDISAWRRIIDLSADSTGNFNGPSIAEGRAAVLAAGITINGLPLLCRDCAPGTGVPGTGLEAEFADKIIDGPGAFVVTADGPAAFADAIRRKLILEISGDHGGPAFAGAP